MPDRRQPLLKRGLLRGLWVCREVRPRVEPSPRVRLVPSARLSRSAAAPPGPPVVSPRPYSARAEPKTLLTRRHVVPARVRRSEKEAKAPVSPRTAAFTRPLNTSLFEIYIRRHIYNTHIDT